MNFQETIGRAPIDEKEYQKLWRIFMDTNGGKIVSKKQIKALVENDPNTVFNFDDQFGYGTTFKEALELQRQYDIKKEILQDVKEIPINNKLGMDFSLNQTFETPTAVLNDFDDTIAPPLPKNV